MFFIELLSDDHLNYETGKGILTSVFMLSSFIGYITIARIWISFEDFLTDKYLVEVKFIYSNSGLSSVLHQKHNFDLL